MIDRFISILILLAVSLMVPAALRGESPQRLTVPTTDLPPDVDSVVTVTTTTVITKVFKSHGTKEQADTVKTVSEAETPVKTVAGAGNAEADTVSTSIPARPVYTKFRYGRPVNDNGKIVVAEIDPALLSERVVVGRDTIPIFLKAPNYGRYDRGLFNFLFIPRGQWMLGLSASYGEFTSDDVQILSVLKDFNFKGKLYSIQPTVSYFFRNNQSMGLRFNYSRGIADLRGLSVDFDDDINFTLSDVSYFSQMFTASLFYRNYVGLGTDKRFALFNEIDLSFGGGTSRFKRSYDGEMKDTKTMISKWGLNFSPGITMFVMDQVCFNVSFGVFGLHVTHERQLTNGVEEGERTSSGANFRFNLFNINFGLGVTI